jgi:hypothetical protein
MKPETKNTHDIICFVNNESGIYMNVFRPPLNVESSVLIISLGAPYQDRH